VLNVNISFIFQLFYLATQFPGLTRFDNTHNSVLTASLKRADVAEDILRYLPFILVKHPSLPEKLLHAVVLLNMIMNSIDDWEHTEPTLARLETMVKLAIPIWNTLPKFPSCALKVHRLFELLPQIRRFD